MEHYLVPRTWIMSVSSIDPETSDIHSKMAKWTRSWSFNELIEMQSTQVTEFDLRSGNMLDVQYI